MALYKDFDATRVVNSTSLYDDGTDEMPKVADINKLEEMLSDEGSEHYKHGSVQPAVFIRANDMPFFEGSAVKYIARHRHSKDGKRDLEKAIHYLRMIIVCDYE
jgi:hypothetical protein